MESTPENAVPPGRALFLAGLAACVLGPVVVILQISLKHLATPWYSPALATAGVLLLAVALTRRPTVVRAVTLFGAVAFAGLQWFFIGSLLRLPDYAGPQPGGTLPPFRATSAGGPFTEADLRDGSHRVMVFFRGRW